MPAVTAPMAAFAERCKEDRHHFRFIISPEDAGDMTDLTAFTRDLARQMETDLGTRLDWVAVDHWNTDNPHVHLLVRGVDEQDADLVISRDYISQGLRSRAEELVAIELGPKPEHEIRNSLEREVSAERWTRLDREIRLAADETGYIDVRPENPGKSDPEIRRLMVGRLQHLEKMGLAASAAPGEWPSVACATSACAATSSKPCTAPSPSVGKLGALPTMPSRLDNRRPRLSDGSSTEDCTTN
jgi:type IV secretory pathway VirD2 relaxase